MSGWFPRLCALALLLSASLAPGCGGDQQQGTPPSPQATVPAEATGPNGEVGAEGPATETEEGASWSTAGGESGGGAGAAGRIRAVEFEDRGGYERVLVGFAPGGEAGVPRWSLEKPREGGYLRLYLPGVTSTRIAGEDLAGLVADAYYVVRQPEGGLFVDVLALGAFEYRVTELAETGQIALDFRNASGGLTCPAVQAENTVVTQPCEAEEAAVGEPLAVEGYSRDPESSLPIVLLDEEGAPLASETVRPVEGGGAWEYFESQVVPPPSYDGLATLRVGVRDGSWAEVPVFFGVRRVTPPSST